VQPKQGLLSFGHGFQLSHCLFRALTILDVYTREGVAIEAGQRLKGEDVVRVLNRVKQQRGVPKFLFCDNGSEFTSQAMDLWAYQNGMKIDFSRPGKPTDNAYVESFNGTFRAECLNAHWFGTLAEAKRLIEDGGRNTMRVVLTDLSVNGHRASSPVSTRLAAYSLQPKPAED
jgi:transposase InsO family protein